MTEQEMNKLADLIVEKILAKQEEIHCLIAEPK
jgi:hypothetical protein